MGYFELNGLKTIEDLKKQYRKLALKYHPDVNQSFNSEAVMKAINEEYEALFGYIKAGYTPEQAKKCHSTIDDNYREIINSIIFLHGLNIDLVGSWLWIGGNTLLHSKVLRELGFKWSSKRKMWYWRPGKYSHRGRGSNMNYENLKNKYGYENFKTKENQAIA